MAKAAIASQLLFILPPLCIGAFREGRARVKWRGGEAFPLSFASLVRLYMERPPFTRSTSG
jgi:hypothetical protein